MALLKEELRESPSCRLGLYTFTADSLNSIPGQGTKIPQATQHGKKKKKRGDQLHFKAPDLLLADFPKAC